MTALEFAGIGHLPYKLSKAHCLEGTPRVAPIKRSRKTAEKLRVNMDTVQRLLRQKKLPGVKIGAQWRVTADALKAYIEGGERLKGEA